MKYLRLAVAAIALAGIWAPAAMADYTRIKTEADFRKLVVGKKLWLDKNNFVIRANGRLRGKFSGQTVKGLWEWREGYWCRTLTEPRQNTDCQTWSVDGKSLRVTRQRGKGKSFVYTIK